LEVLLRLYKFTSMAPHPHINQKGEQDRQFHDFDRGDLI
jgi:hypothetical protein